MFVSPGPGSAVGAVVANRPDALSELSLPRDARPTVLNPAGQFNPGEKYDRSMTCCGFGSMVVVTWTVPVGMQL